MWANSVWGLFGTAFACFLSKLGVSNVTTIWWLNLGIGVFSGLGFFVLCFPTVRRFISKNLAPHPIEIFFDAKNTARKFWSLETHVDPKGLGPPRNYWEYRVEIRNRSNKTLRNVRVFSELIGPLPVRPTPMKFDASKSETCDINPGARALIQVIHWMTPIKQAGMLAGPSAESYGPLHVTASADDTPATSRTFRFDYQKEPMIYD